MQALFTILGDSFVIWSRNFTLMYVVLFLSLIVGSLLQQAGIPAWEWRWMLLIGVIILLFGAFMAGWFNMVALACRRYFSSEGKNASLEASTLQAFSLFGAFLPGIARRFPSMALGMLIQAAMLFALFQAVRPHWLRNAPLLDKLYAHGLPSPEAIQKLNMTQQLSLSELSLALLAAMTIYGIFSLVTMLWPAYLVLYNDSAPRAYWRSLVQFLRDPLRLTAISGMFLLAQLGLTMATPGLPYLLAICLQFMTLLVQIYMAVVIFVYVYRMVGAPGPDMAEDGGNGKTPDSANNPPVS